MLATRWPPREGQRQGAPGSLYRKLETAWCLKHRAGENPRAQPCTQAPQPLGATQSPGAEWA